MNHTVYYWAGELKVKEKYVYNSLYIVYSIYESIIYSIFGRNNNTIYNIDPCSMQMKIKGFNAYTIRQ